MHAALGNLGRPAALSEPGVERPTAAQIRKSITRDALISFIDDKAYKPLKRHLTRHGLTPQAYCARYGLPNDYPMGAPRYAAQRYELAKAIGLGRFAMKAAAQKPKKAAVEEPKTRGRRRAA